MIDQKNLLKKEEWSEYWKSRTIKKRIIEYVREFYFAKIFVRKVTKFVSKGPVLEAGCGSASISRLLKKKSIITIGVDDSLEAIQIARQNCTYVVLADINNIPFKNNSFEVVFNQGVMEHFTKNEFFAVANEIKFVASKFIVFMPCNTSIFKWLYNPFNDVKNQDVFWSKKRLFEYLKSAFSNVSVNHLPSSLFISMVGYAEK